MDILYNYCDACMKIKKMHACSMSLHIIQVGSHVLSHIVMCYPAHVDEEISACDEYVPRKSHT